MSTPAHAQSHRVRGSVIAAIGRVTLYALLVAGGLFMLMPFIWMLSSSLKDLSLIHI